MYNRNFRKFNRKYKEKCVTPQKKKLPSQKKKEESKEGWGKVDWEEESNKEWGKGWEEEGSNKEIIAYLKEANHSSGTVTDYHALLF
jgi:hypothetical protein